MGEHALLTLLNGDLLFDVQDFSSREFLGFFTFEVNIELKSTEVFDLGAEETLGEIDLTTFWLDPRLDCPLEGEVVLITTFIGEF